MSGEPIKFESIDADIRHCEICGAEAVEDDENSAFRCSANVQHICSQWDMIWIDWGLLNDEHERWVRRAQCGI